VIFGQLHLIAKIWLGPKDGIIMSVYSGSDYDTLGSLGY
jgi:hypothetical protein